MNTLQDSENPVVQEHFLELLHRFDTAMLVTRGRSGHVLRARPLSIARIEADGTLWFLTDVASAKVAELALDSRAMAVFSNSNQFVVMNGEVEVLRDATRARELWKEPFRVWFTGPDDTSLALLRFLPVDGEYWNNAGAQGIKQAFRAAKAYIQNRQLKDGDVNDPGVHGKVGGES
jgi:general stress protein 26